MRILFTGVRDDEMPAVNEWIANHPEHEVVTTTKNLTLENIEMVEGFDALTVQQVLVPEAEVYTRLKEYGITQLSSRTAGVDMYDLVAARENGIAISNVPVYSPNAIAEFALTSALYLTRRFPVILERNAKRDFRFAGMIGREIATMKVAILGTGAIGTITARHFKALGAEIVGFDLYPRDEFREVGTYVDSIEEAVTGADIVSLHMPATAENHHLFGKEMLQRFAPGAVLVNAARGALVDTEALLEVLEEGHLSGAALDTYENEQKYFRYDWSDKDLGDPVLEQLLDRDDVLVTPHVAFYTETAVQNLVYGGLDNAVEVKTTGTCPSVVN
ncbi:D-2-hydroxyacid dehydrogenase [Dermabacteraceae bacterium P13115]